MGDLEGEDTNLFYALYVLSTAADGRLRPFTQHFNPKDKSTSFVVLGSHNVYPVEEPQQHRHNTVVGSLLLCCQLHQKPDDMVCKPDDRSVLTENCHLFVGMVIMAVAFETNST